MRGLPLTGCIILKVSLNRTFGTEGSFGLTDPTSVSVTLADFAKVVIDSPDLPPRAFL